MDEPVRDDAAHLKSLREAAGLEVSDLAAMSNLSAAQIRQLEDGGESLFYSPQIKNQSLRRVIRLLETPAGPDIDLQDKPQQGLQTGQNVIDNIIRLSEKNLKSNLVTSAVRRPGASKIKLLAYVGIASTLAALFAWQFNRHESQALYSEWVEPVTATVLTTTEQVSEPVAQVVEPVAAAPVVAAPTVAVANPTEPVTEEDCRKLASVPTPIATSIHNKPGNYVHLFSNKAIEVCVDDGKNTRTMVNLTPGVGRSVVGVSPWTLSSNELKSVQIYFQGGKVLLPPDAGARIYLKELPVSP